MILTYNILYALILCSYRREVKRASYWCTPKALALRGTGAQTCLALRDAEATSLKLCVSRKLKKKEGGAGDTYWI